MEEFVVAYGIVFGIVNVLGAFMIGFKLFTIQVRIYRESNELNWKTFLFSFLFSLVIGLAWLPIMLLNGFGKIGNGEKNV